MKSMSNVYVPAKTGNARIFIIQNRARADHDLQYASYAKLTGVSRTHGEIKHHIFSRLQNDAGKEPDQIKLHFSDQLSDEYFAGVLSETYNKERRRYEKKPGVRNEPLDTLGYAYAALHHSSIRAHRFQESDWKRLEQSIVEKKTTMSVSGGRINLDNLARFR